jgi:outer membrane protein insertion porin family
MLFTIGGGAFQRTLSLLLVLLLLIPTIAFAQEKPVTEIKIAGNTHISSDAILAVISPYLKVGSVYSETAVQAARTAIRNMGYFSDEPTTSIEVSATGVKITFNVIENPVVKQIKITGNTKMSTAKLLSLMRTQVGLVYNENTISKDADAIQKLYSNAGYLAQVTENLGIDSNGVVTVPIMEIRIEAIRITGLKKTKSIVVLREMELKPGDVFNRITMAQDITHVYDLDIFDREVTDPYTLESGSSFDKIIIVIPLKEKKTGEVTVGVGYSATDKLTGRAQLSQNNFRGMAETVNLLWTESIVGGPGFDIGFFEPWLDKKHTSLGLDLYDKNIYRFSSSILADTSNNYDERREGGSATLGRPLSRQTRGFFTFRAESVRTGLLNTSGNLITPTTGDPLIADGNVVSGTFRLTNDKRDSTLEPFNGTYSSVSVETGDADSTELGTTIHENGTFTKYSFDVRSYLSKGGLRKTPSERRKVIALRLMAGSLTGPVPFFEQYFMGGAETLRGYREDRFWGTNMFLSSIEYRHPMAPSLTGVLFVDCGDAWGAPLQYRENTQQQPVLSDLTQHANFQPTLGYGLGIRVITPIGPLRLDYGFGNEGSRAHFSIGHVF